MKKTITECIKNRWGMPGGYKEFLKLAFPLILTTGTWTVQQFVNRIFLTWYSPNAIAASMPAGMLGFAILSIFMGTITYVDVFVAQYYGAGQKRSIGPAIWQGIYFSFIGGLLMLCMIPLAAPIFNLIGHDPAVRADEIVYLKFITLSDFPALASAGLAGFYSGRGKTWNLAIVNLITIAVNIILDNILIFGKLGLPAMGIKGAGIATILASFISFGIYLFMVTSPENEKEYATRAGWRINFKLIKRILRYGLPSGAHFFLDIAGFTAFILIMGTLGTVPLAATNIAFNISSLAFMPMIGCAIAVSILVGQKLGANNPGLAQRSVWSGFHLTFIYMICVAILYITIPSFFVGFYAAHADASAFADIGALVTVLLRFVALYSLFDAMNIIFAAAIKGAGDTHYVMRFIVVVSIIVLVVPAYIAMQVLHLGIFSGWTIASLYIAVLGLAFFRRFLTGKWKSMRVIESVPIIFPELPETSAAGIPTVVMPAEDCQTE